MAITQELEKLTLAPGDPSARAEQTFPRLEGEIARRVAAYGAEESLADRALLFERGQRGVDFFLVTDGELEVFDTSACGRESVFAAHSRGSFTGELDQFNDRQILVSARAKGPTRVVRVKRADLARLMAAEPDIGEIITRAYILRRVALIRNQRGGVMIVGAAHHADTLRLQRFLIRNGYPHRLLDVESDPDADAHLAHFGLARADLPAVVTPGERVHSNPANAALAEALGLTQRVDPTHVHDVAVIGAGPAGLAAAVYAASEGLDTIVIEGLAPGGQAGTSSKIENYLGFPTGISGQALAGRAMVQAQKFGARLEIAREAVAIRCATTPYGVELSDGQTLLARSIVIATGARYRKLDVANYERFEGQGIHYAATAMEAQLCGGEPVVVVGGGNSAGQAAMFLARSVAHVHLLVRGAGLAATMSDYLVQRIASSPRISLHPACEICSLEGDDALRRVAWRCISDGARTEIESGNVFVMIGAEPNTAWLDGCVSLDASGFVVTGAAPDGRALGSPFETTLPGVFAVGDVRAGSIKRVAASVGEGSVVVHAIHRHLNG
jgi:thioredoxin reductase (NADPH)